MAKFKDVIICLKNGGTATRQAWSDRNIEVMMQIPQRIAKEIVPKMTSVQEIIKTKINTVGSGEIEYHDQVLIITFVDDDKTPAKATYYVPSWEDIFAEDWIVTNSFESFIKCLVDYADDIALRHDELLDLTKTGMYERHVSVEKKEAIQKEIAALSTLHEVLVERYNLEKKENDTSRI